ncbi:uncharacterized protein BX664DRAFT_343401 [Halteromyces radiatus]|uniref:uncharacterized protein n=1 Tax=Halteromyces radiatus TaxID=101107 RepID=UPI00221FF6BD|nr:uncharacterized protein BX664DRAFT_343401 [Halteromyces radiatus]KAI8077754.1 hypothetical protein BX664DRAFT_343401 [Halteromyces radiatus]
MSWILPFRSKDKLVATQCRNLTLSLYRSLLRAAHQFDTPEQQWFLHNTIRERFRFHQCETSRRKIVSLVSEGDKALHQLNQALEGHSATKKYILDLSSAKIGPLHHVITKLRKIPNLLQRSITATDIRSQASKHRHPSFYDRISLPPHLISDVRLTGLSTPVPSNRKEYKVATKTLEIMRRQQKNRRKSIVREWKPYQVKRVVQASSGFKFIRRRGFRQPVTTSMMMKQRTRTIQKRLDLYYHLRTQRDYMKSEQIFLNQLGVKNDCREYIQPITEAIKNNNTFIRPTIDT